MTAISLEARRESAEDLVELQPVQSSKGDDAAPPSLAAAVVRGITWNTGAVIAQSMLGFVATIVVARHLSPHDFAVVGIAVTVTAVLNVIVTNTFGTAIVQRAEITASVTDSVFWLMAAVGGLLAAVVALAGGAIGNAYSEQAVSLPLAVLSFTILAAGIAQVPLAILQRRMQFREISVLRTVSVVVAATAAVAVAVRGGGYWALITQYTVAETLIAITAMLAAGYRPRFHFDRDDIAATAPFAAAITAYNLLYTLGTRADYLIMARYWPSSSAGLYYFAYERSRQVLNLMVMQVSGTLLSALSRMQHDRARLKNAFLRSTRMWCLFIYPCYILLIGLADPVIPLLFGNQWRSAIPVFRILAAFILVGGPWSMASDALSAAGWPQGNVYFAIVRLVATLPVLIVLGVTGASMVTTATVLLAIWFVIAPLWGVFLRATIGLTFSELWRELRGVVIVSGVMGVVFALVQFALVERVSGVIGSAMAAIVASLVYVVMLRDSLLDLLGEWIRAVTNRGGEA